MTKMRKIWYGVLLALSAALLVLGSFFDKSVATAMYSPGNIPAKIMESAGIFPPFIFFSGLAAVIFFLIGEESKCRVLKKVLCVVVAAASYLVFGYMAANYASSYLLLWAKALIAAGVAGVLTPLTFILFRKKSKEGLKRFLIFLIFASMVSFISTVLTVNVLKYFWGRPRYYEMIRAKDEALTAFTPWYHPNGFTLKGHHSFPSGHTASATNLLVFCALPEVFPQAENKKGTVTFVCAVYIFSMAYSRMVLGAHFLSDVTAGFIIGFVTYAVARYLYFDKSRIVLDALISINTPQKTEPTEERRAAENESVEASTEEAAEPAATDAAETGENGD